MDLTPEQTAELRRRAYASQRRLKGRCVPARFIDGPLAGATIAIEESFAQMLSLGWCVPYERGVLLDAASSLIACGSALASLTAARGHWGRGSG